MKNKYIVNRLHHTIESKTFDEDSLTKAVLYALKQFKTNTLYGDEVTVEDSTGRIITRFRK